jgi:hypothetical protein
MLHLLLPLMALASPNLPSDIASVYSYQCEATFLEGEGVGPYEMSCPAYQQLGLITAKYTRYLFSSSFENNFQKKEVNHNYSQPLCEKTVSWLSCTKSAPRLQFGLSRTPEGPFQAQVLLAPSFTQGNEVYGYAAMLLPDGSCPEGLVRARLFEAQPESVAEPLPSNFINREGNLNGQVVGVEGTPVPDFTVSRQKNEMPCDGRGSCRNAEFMQPEIVQEVPYSALDPVVCVVPKEALGNLKARH